MAAEAERPPDEAYREIQLEKIPRSLRREDCEQLCSQFGPIESVSLNNDARQAIIRFSEAKSARAFFDYFRERELAFKGTRIQLRYTGVDELSIGPEKVERAVFLGSLEPSTSLREICVLGNMFGMIESVSIMQRNRTRSAFINFVDPLSAQNLIHKGQNLKLELHGHAIFNGMI